MIRWRGIGAVAALLISASALAQRPTVDVAFTITQPQFDVYGELDLKLISSTIAEGLALTMNGPAAPPPDNRDHGAFPLFDFRSSPAGHHLTIEVADDPRALGIAPAVVLNLRMDDPAKHQQPLVIELRPAGGARDEPAGEPLVFATEVLGVIRNHIQIHRQDWTDKLFAHIVVAEDVPTDGAETAFKMPFPAEQYEFSTESLFRVVTSDATIDVKPKPFKTPMLLPVDHPPPLVQKVSSGANVKNQVHVVTYDQLRPATTQKPPSAAVQPGSR